MINPILDFNLSNYLLNFIVILLIVISIKIIIAKDLLEAVIYTSAFSLLIGISYLIMDAPDVAMTETALGACFSTCVYLGLLRKLPSNLKDIQRTRVIQASIICLLFIITLTYMGMELYNYGEVSTPLQTHISKYYIENTAQDIGIPSLVAAILASYRGYDTLGETSVILIAGISVLLILSKKFEVDSRFRGNDMEGGNDIEKSTNSAILYNKKSISYLTSFIIPYIILYSLYILLNGESSPGGGFQAGVIFASSLIGYDLVYGNQKLQRYFSVNTMIFIAVLGIMIYGFVGTISLFFNDNYLNYYSLSNSIDDKLTAQHIAIFIVEVGIGLTVSSAMYLIYTLFNHEEFVTIN